MSSFPSSDERTVASSLLLLHTATPSPSLSTPKFHSVSDDLVPVRRSSKNFRKKTESIGYSKSSSSSLTNDDGDSSEEEIKSRRASFISAIARYHQMKFKIARKTRSKVTWTSSCTGDRESNSGEDKVSPNSVSGEATSCLSSGSSGISSALGLRYANRNRGTTATVTRNGREAPPPPRHQIGSPHLRRRGEAILKFLSIDGGCSEVRIRQTLGDSPDTSKALRMLLKVDAVKRSGSGGRHDPYVYSITG